MKAITLGLLVAVVGVSGAAAAQQREQPAKPQSGIGMSLEAGGGIGGFIGDTANGATSAQGQWQARMVFGTRTRFAGEAAYVGTANAINTFGVSPNSVMTGNGAEGLFRVNFLKDEWQPYAAAGVGFMYYSLGNAQLSTADVEPTGTAATFPVGVGLSWRRSGVIVDGRFSFHPATNVGVIRGANFSTWDLNAKAGFEF